MILTCAFERALCEQDETRRHGEEEASALYMALGQEARDMALGQVWRADRARFGCLPVDPRTYSCDSEK